MELKIWGGAGEHGRSCYYLKVGDIRLLFDCGVKKGAGSAYPLIDPYEVQRLNAVFLTHSHEDHSAAIPLLYKLGYRGEVYATQPTAEQYQSYIQAWRKSAEERDASLPYDRSDESRVKFHILPQASGMLRLDGGIRVFWGRSGHLLGAVWFVVIGFDQTFFYSGDYTPESALLKADCPMRVLERYDCGNARVDLAVVDSAYGCDDRSQEQYVGELLGLCREVRARGGKLLLPLPAYGRGQELLCLLNENDLDLPICVEQEIYSPLSHYMLNRSFLNNQAGHWLRRLSVSDRLNVIENAEQRRRHVHDPECAILLTTDGMMSSRLGRWYFDHLKADPRNCVVFTGHVATGTPGDQLLTGPMDTDIQLQIEHCLYKVHQGVREVRTMLDQLRPLRTILCHASRSKTDELASMLSSRYPSILSLGPGQSVVI